MEKSTLGFLALLLIILSACGNDSENQNSNQQGNRDQATSVETITISQQDISRQIRSFGTVKAQDVVQVTPQVSNRVTEIYADLGDTVSQGQKLAKIYDNTSREKVQQAQAQLEQSQAAFGRDSAQYARQQKLYERDLISKAELENASATLESSRAQMQSAQATLTQNRETQENTIIRSPVYGAIITRNIAAGDLATTGQAAFEIGNLTAFETRVYLPLEEWERVEIGQKVNFRLSNRRESSATGRVARKSPRLDPTTGLGEVVIAFTNKGPSIHLGVLVESVINVETNKNAVVIPRSALVENVQTLIEPESNTIQTERTYASFVVQGDSLALKRDLSLGIEQGDKVEITNGLQAGDEIVITGQASLEDSTKIQVARSTQFQDPSVPIGDGQGDQQKDNRSSVENSSTHSSSTNSNNN